MRHPVVSSSRGARLTELLKQPQYSPYPVEEQVVSIWAGTNGKLDSIEVEDVLPFERELLDYLRRNTTILDTLRDTNVLDDDTAAELAKKTDEFILEFRAGKGQAIDHAGPRGVRGRRRRRREPGEDRQGSPLRRNRTATMGAQLRVYKQKINTAQTTKKITKAMELIAASRIQKAMARVRASSPFARAVTRAVSAVATHSNVEHPLTREREVIRRSAVVIFASDRGLAGAFNSQILREGLELAELLRRQGKEPVFYLVGRKAVGYFQFRRIAERGGVDGRHRHAALPHGRGDRRDAARRVRPRRRRRRRRRDPPRLQPLRQHDDADARDGAPAAARGRRGRGASSRRSVYPLYEFEPDAETVLDALLPVYIQSRVFNALLQSSAAKHAATQKAMKSASDNADKLITDYTRLRNNARQAEITQQIAEIVGGADALSSGK